MKEVKKETKIVVGISITLVLLAIIVTVVVLAVKSAKRGTQLLRTEYARVENDGGVVTMRDGLFVAAVDGGVALFREDKQISKKYADLRLKDEEKKIYEFAAFDGHYGRIDENGNEILSVASNGNFIGDTAQFTDFDFCPRHDDGRYLVGLCERQFDRVFKHSETRYVISALGGSGQFENVLPSGIFFALDAFDGDEYFIASSLEADKIIELNGYSVEKLAYDFITLAGAEGRVTYSLPSLERVSALDGVAGENIFGSKGVLFCYDAGKIRRIGGEEFAVSFKPQRIVAQTENKALFVGNGNGVFFDGGVVTEGTFEDLGVVYRVGTKVIYAHSLGVSAVENATLTRINSGDKIFFFVGKVVNGTAALYEYKDGALEFKSDAAYTTYKNPYFESSRYKGEYDVYFMYDGVTYDTDFNVVAVGTIIRRNLVRNGNVYTDIKGGSEIKDSERFYDVYDFAGNALNEYLFAKSDGFLYTSNDKQLPNEFDADVTRVVKAENGTYVFVTSGGIACGQSVIYRSEYDDCVFMDDGNIAFISSSQIRVAKATKRGLETVSSYGFFDVALDSYYKLSSKTANGVIFGKTCSKGIVFTAGNGKSGLIDSGGRLSIAPSYEKIYLTEYYAVLVNGKDEYARFAIFDFRGRQVTDFEYISVLPLGSFAAGLKADGTAELINARGNNVAKSIVFGDVLSVNNYVTVSGRYAIDEKVDYAFVNVGGKYRLIRVYL